MAVDWESLVRFVGYGPSRSTDILFLGLEEKGFQEEPAFRVRSTFKSVEDLREAHGKFSEVGCYNPFHDFGNPVQQWNTASKFALALAGEEHWFAPENWGQYWRNELGRAHGSTFLMECFPFPKESRAIRIQGYPGWSEDQVWEKRYPHLREYLDAFPPRTVIAYGLLTKEKASELFDVPLDNWRPVNGVRKTASIASNHQTKLLHVGFFGQGRFSSEDVPALVSALLQH